MFIFSIPEDIPNNDTINTISNAIKCHGTLPNEPDICPKYAPESVAVNALPVIYPTKNLINQPTTIAYPIAIINVPTTGITPNTFPPFFPLVCKALSNAPIGPDYIILPNANSPINPVEPKRIINII